MFLEYEDLVLNLHRGKCDVQKPGDPVDHRQRENTTLGNRIPKL